MEDKLNELSIINALIFGVLLAISYYALFYHASSPEAIIASLDQQIISLKAEVSQLDRKIQEGEKLKLEIADMTAKADQVYKYIPSEMSLEQGSSTVSEEARLAGLSIQSIRPGQSWENKNTVSVGSVDVSVQGKFNQIMIFLSEMTRKDQIYSIKRIRISEVSEGEGDLSLSAKIDFFKRYEASEEEG